MEDELQEQQLLTIPEESAEPLDKPETLKEPEALKEPETLKEPEALKEPETLKEPEALKEIVEVKEGVLTEEMVCEGLSHLGLDLTGQHQVLCHLSIPNLSLIDISLLCKYVNLEKLELQHNNIEDISCLNHIPHLIYLDVSHNEISNFFQFQPLRYLEVANFSHNRIPDIKNLAGFLCLRQLNLDYNCLSEVSGLTDCSMLNHLSLAYNKISKISNLDNLPITYLCLKGNQLHCVEGLEKLQNIQVLDLSRNCITSLSGIQNLRYLYFLNLENNQIMEIEDLKHAIDLLMLSNLNLLENPVQEHHDYRLKVIFLYRGLSILDNKKVTVEEKVSSLNMFGPPMDIVAATDHITNMVHQMAQPQVLYQSTMPTPNTPYPMLVVTGPEGCRKGDLVRRLCQEFGKDFGVGICHSTRQPYPEEENGVDYHFVSEDEFQNLFLMGKFLLTMHYGSHLFGLSRDAIEEVANYGVVCCLHMELEGVFSLKKTCFRPRYILLIPTEIETFITHMKSTNRYTQSQIDLAVQRVPLYSKTNEERPGFFDNVIPSDNYEEAYQALVEIVKDYMFVEELSEDEEEEKTREEEEKPKEEEVEKEKSSVEEPATPVESESLPGPTIETSLAKVQADSSCQKTLIELASLRKREELAREAVVGKKPGLHSHLFKQYSSEVSRAASALDVPVSLGGTVEPLERTLLEHTTEMLNDCNMGPSCLQSSLDIRIVKSRHLRHLESTHNGPSKRTKEQMWRDDFHRRFSCCFFLNKAENI
ncbi:leucine-rich repeat and guanylate kinase domain-containing protein isoform X2 [Xiphophorus hellerii]|uniref:leucine-rich repeat and guanylate kinase domain-containing protein isoform X2 n=1 Tax=Xiphophorus hellerii TaxID=8084 RepID=UPI0013B3AA92|nr:leucine-rich repeat and guanylate kinase domain-containing protein isoform X2 [Xiphophorus hellerii]